MSDEVVPQSYQRGPCNSKFTQATRGKCCVLCVDVRLGQRRYLRHCAATNVTWGSFRFIFFCFFGGGRSLYFSFFPVLFIVECDCLANVYVPGFVVCGMHINIAI